MPRMRATSSKSPLPESTLFRDPFVNSFGEHMAHGRVGMGMERATRAQFVHTMHSH